MKLLDVVTAPWAIDPAKLLEIQAIYATHLRGEKIDIPQLEARLGRPLQNEPRSYEVVDGVAVLPLEGVVAKRMNLLSQISGGMSTELASRNLRQALDDPAVHSIIQWIDSPGGTVDGSQAYANEVFAARGRKPIVSLASGAMASAAYWFGSAASRVYIADLTTVAGSIGIVAKHVDVSGAEAKAGVKTTEIAAGKYKRLASAFEPLTADARQSIQDQVDYTYSIFVADVARFRGVSEEKVLEDMAEGRVFIGQQAIDAGLVDGVSTLDDLVAQLNRERAGVALRPQSTTRATGASMPITREQLAAEAPELLNSLLAEGEARGEPKWRAAERDRIKSVLAQSMPGHEALVHKMAFETEDSPGDVAQAVLAAEKKARGDRAAELANDAPAALALRPSSTVRPEEKKGPLSRAETDQKAKAYVATHPGTTYVQAVKIIEQQGA